LTLLQQNTEINNVKVFDIYKGPHIPQWKKSIAISFDIYGDGTMSSDQINRIMNTIIEQAKTVNAHLR
jgi:phenylalanyl-tRNA synthetase beta subunit